jgi:hypothetical protein
MALLHVAGILLATTAVAQIRLDAPPSVVIRGGAGATDFRLVNAGSQPAALDLKAGGFVDWAARTTLTKPKIAFTVVPGNTPPQSPYLTEIPSSANFAPPPSTSRSM